jgi:hypothetical protein
MKKRRRSDKGAPPFKAVEPTEEGLFFHAYAKRMPGPEFRAKNG